jgi:hypothetical protein
VPINIPNVDDDDALSLSPNDVVLGYISRIPFSLRWSVEIL